jgi:hypothetical protein
MFIVIVTYVSNMFYNWYAHISYRYNGQWYVSCSLELVKDFWHANKWNEMKQLALFLVHRFFSPWWRRRYIPPKLWFLQQPHGVTSKKTQFFIVTAAKTSNLTLFAYLAKIFPLSNRARNYHWFYENTPTITILSHINLCRFQVLTAMIMESSI